MQCPVCKKVMYDNRNSKKNPKGPDYKCKDKSCRYQFDRESGKWVESEYVTAVWEPKETPKEPPKEAYHGKTELPKHEDPPPPEPDEALDVFDEEGTWLTYRQRVQEIIELFSAVKDPCDTSRAGAILGLRELMKLGRYQ